MKNYELTVLYHPDLEMNLAPALEKVASLIEANGGKIDKQSVNDGKKRLAYPIKKQDFAIYYYYNVALPADAPGKISQALNINDEVLRYLLVVADERRAKAAAKAAEAATNENSKSTEEGA